MLHYFQVILKVDFSIVSSLRINFPNAQNTKNYNTNEV